MFSKTPFNKYYFTLFNYMQPVKENKLLPLPIKIIMKSNNHYLLLECKKKDMVVNSKIFAKIFNIAKYIEQNNLIYEKNKLLIKKLEKKILKDKEFNITQKELSKINNYINTRKSLEENVKILLILCEENNLSALKNFFSNIKDKIDKQYVDNTISSIIANNISKEEFNSLIMILKNSFSIQIEDLYIHLIKDLSIYLSNDNIKEIIEYLNKNSLSSTNDTDSEAGDDIMEAEKNTYIQLDKNKFNEYKSYSVLFGLFCLGAGLLTAFVK